MAKNIAVVLSGCGFLDGSEITEAVLTLLALDQAGAQYACFAPDREQRDVINHLTQTASSESRNILVESARIVRGNIKPIDKLDAADFDAVIFPGGYGAAKNLCDYAVAGNSASTPADVARVVQDFHKAGKPVGALCISPAMIAATLGKDCDGLQLTIGNDAATATDLESMGVQHQERSVRDVCVDQKNRVVSTPAYMYETKPADVFTAIEKLVREVLAMA